MKRLIQVSILLVMSSISYTQTTSTITDPRDGQSYNIVKIGDQWWMAENLRASKYNNGDPILNVTDNDEWANLINPGFCWYNNDEETFKYPYGALYNWYAVNTGKLCPLGWHVPSDQEWTTLITYLGGESIAGDKLKEAGYDHWLNPESNYPDYDGGTNESGFTALPGGYRLNNGFLNIRLGGYWWSDSEKENTEGTQAYGLCISYDYSLASRIWGPKLHGNSVRCVKSEFVQGVPGQIISESITLTQDIAPGSGPGLIVAGNNVVVNGNGHKILGNGAGDGVVIENSSDVKVKLLFVSGFEKAIDIKGGSNINISEGYISKSDVGLFVDISNTGTSITNNIIARNKTGLQLESGGHSIYHNLLLNNEQQVDVAGNNTWNDPKGLGNYWNNYWGKDDGGGGRTVGDFIGDTRLPHEGVDNYPLLDPTIPGQFGDLLWTTLTKPSCESASSELPLSDPLLIASGPLIESSPIAPQPLPPTCCSRWYWFCCQCGCVVRSPGDLQAIDPLGRVVSSEINLDETNAFYTEDNEVSIPGEKLINILMCPSMNDINDYKGKLTFKTYAPEDSHFSMAWFVSSGGKRLFYGSYENVLLPEGETSEVVTDISTKVDKDGCPLEIYAIRVVQIDILPGSDRNCIYSKANGTIPVAIFGRADFDVKTIDPVTIKLEALSLNMAGLSNKLQAHYEDVNNDGYVDLVGQIDGGKREFTIGSTVATLTGRLKSVYGGWRIAGQDLICVVPPKSSNAMSSIQDENYTPETQFELLQNYPNPFTDKTTIWFSLPEDTKVLIEVFDLMGNKITTLLNRNLGTGYHKVEFDSKNLKEGTYTYRIRAGKYHTTKNMIHISK